MAKSFFSLNEHLTQLALGGGQQDTVGTKSMSSRIVLSNAK